MVSLGEFAAAMAGAGRLLRFDAKGVLFFENSLPAFWRSFSAAVLVAPFYFALLFIDVAADPNGSPIHTMLVQAIAYVIGWVAYPLVMVHLSRHLDREALYFRYMVSYNWFQVVQAALLFPASLLASMGYLPDGAVALLGSVVLTAILVYDWFIARSGLQIDGAKAVALAIIDLLLGLLISGIADRLV